MVSGKKLLEVDCISQALTHLLAVHRDHVVVDPEPHEGFPGGCLRLGYLALVVGKGKVRAAAMDVHDLAEQGGQRPFGGDGGPQLDQGVPQLADRSLGVLVELFQVGRGFVTLAVDALELQRDVGEPLSQPVVEVAGDPAALLGMTAMIKGATCGGGFMRQSGSSRFSGCGWNGPRR